MAEATAAAELTMKLLIDRKVQRVLFAEAGKDIVDFLFSLLALPVATAVRLLGEAAMVGSVGSLYASVQRLDGTYVLPGATKNALLHPTVASPAVSTNSSLLLPAPMSPPPKAFFKCGFYQRGTCYDYVTDERGTSCPICQHPMTKDVHYAKPEKARNDDAAGLVAKGFVQGVVTYTVTDNLTVTPMSTISSITLLNTFAVKDIGDLQEKTVQLVYAEGLEILKASLRSNRLFLPTCSSARRLLLTLETQWCIALIPDI